MANKLIIMDNICLLYCCRFKEFKSLWIKKPDYILMHSYQIKQYHDKYIINVIKINTI